MKQILLLLSIIHISVHISGQSTYQFSFEDNIPSTQWVAEQGAFSLSEEHFMDGTKSLCWGIPALEKSIFTVSFTSFNSGSFAAILNIYNIRESENTLLVEFLDGSDVAHKTANVSLNFRGWREFNRVYAQDFQSALNRGIAKVRFTYNNTTNIAQKLFFDNVNFRASTDGARVATDLMILDLRYLAPSTAVLLTNFANNIDMEVVAPTSQELEEINMLRTSYAVAPLHAPGSELRVIRSYIADLNITRNSDGTVRGKAMLSSPSDLTKEFMIDITRKLEAIAYAAMSSEADKILFNDLLDYIIDQGFIYKYPKLVYSDYSTVRTIPRQLISVLPLCTAEQKLQVLKMFRWVVEAGLVYSEPIYFEKNLNSDYIYLYLVYLYQHAVHQIDDSIALREIKALTRFLEQTLQYSDGSYEVIKRDGTGFHHNTHFNGYMYSYNTWVDVIYRLKNTSFQINPESYERLKHAALSLYIMSNRGGVAGNFYANSLCGRHPYYGLKNNFLQINFDKLIEAGGGILGKDIDEDLAAAYNYFFTTSKYSVPSTNFDGFYQFNYSPMGIYRKDNWTVTMRAPTTKFWGAEIYDATNRFGRYQSHGTLEVMYDGALSNSGLPSTAEGWDWNVVPGTTTVHYTSWQEMMPNGNTSARFDQYTKTKDFAGALSWYDCGIFTSDFDQIDTWGAQRFTPTNLEFKKTVFAFDGMLVSMGSNIKSSGNYADNMITATNLFQSVSTDLNNTNTLNINGTIINSGVEPITNNSEQSFWMITPDATGYYIPKGNDKIIVKYGNQEGPIHTGANIGSPKISIAAKAYIDHGIKPTNKNYLFTVVPAANPAKMNNIASKIGDDGGDIYKIESQNQDLHAITLKEKKITAYSAFNPISDMNFGIIKSIDSEILMMVKEIDDTRLSFAISNPNLRPVSDGIKWVSSPTHTRITLKGKWYLDGDAQGIIVNAPVDDETTIDFTLSYGEPIYFNVKPEGYTSTKVITSENDVAIYPATNKNDVIIDFKNPISRPYKIEVYSIDGIKIQENILTSGIAKHQLSINKALTPNFYIIRIFGEGLNRSFKYKL